MIVEIKNEDKFKESTNSYTVRYIHEGFLFFMMNLKDNSQLDSPVDYYRGYISMKPILVN